MFHERSKRSTSLNYYELKLNRKDSWLGKMMIIFMKLDFALSSLKVFIQKMKCLRTKKDSHFFLRSLKLSSGEKSRGLLVPSSASSFSLKTQAKDMLK